MIYFLAEVVAADTQISGNWVLELVAKLFLGLGVLFTAVWAAYKKGQTNQSEVTIKQPVPTVETREAVTFAARNDLDDHIDRTDKSLTELWDAIDGERKIARDALGKIHRRLDEQSTATAKVQGTVDEVKSNVGKLLDLALAPKRPGTR